ncbi:MAG: thioredoxin family protein [Dehalococcoidia bacterium]
MVERALVAVALLALVFGGLVLARRWLAWRDRRLVARMNEAQPAIEAEGGPPRLVYFTTTTCVVCRLQQEPAIEALREHLPELVLERYDAIEARALASEYGVLSVPTTAVYDRTGALVTINRGFAPAAVLLGQIEGRDVATEGGVAMEGQLVDER